MRIFITMFVLLGAHQNSTAISKEQRHPWFHYYGEATGESQLPESFPSLIVHRFIPQKRAESELEKRKWKFDSSNGTVDFNYKEIGKPQEIPHGQSDWDYRKDIFSDLFRVEQCQSKRDDACILWVRRERQEKLYDGSKGRLFAQEFGSLQKIHSFTTDPRQISVANCKFVRDYPKFTIVNDYITIKSCLKISTKTCQNWSQKFKRAYTDFKEEAKMTGDFRRFEKLHKEFERDFQVSDGEVKQEINPSLKKVLKRGNFLAYPAPVYEPQIDLKLTPHLWSRARTSCKNVLAVSKKFESRPVQPNSIPRNTKQSGTKGN